MSRIAFTLIILLGFVVELYATDPDDKLTGVAGLLLIMFGLLGLAL